MIKKLRKRASTKNVFNPYKNRALANNLEKYFEYLYENSHMDVLLIGEAPGYTGCRITGVPFTSATLFQNSELEIFKVFNHERSLEAVANERTAMIVWDYLADKKELPIFWNAFPFHPFKPNNERSNRAPTSKEIEEGSVYIQELVSIFKPTKITAVGRKGEQALKSIYPYDEIIYIRHPSYGGKSEFCRGMDKILW